MANVGKNEVWEKRVFVDEDTGEFVEVEVRKDN